MTSSSRNLSRPLRFSSSMRSAHWMSPYEAIKACRPTRHFRLQHHPSPRALGPPRRTTLPSPLHSSAAVTSQWRQSRALNTERREWLKRQLKFSGKFIIYSWIFAGAGLWAFYTFNQERLERIYPSPPVWKYATRTIYRNAKLHEEPEAFERGVVDWVVTANIWNHLVDELEDPNSEGAGLLEQESEIAGAGIKMGYDIESKPEPWRRGYHEALMGAAKGAENLDGFVRDETRKIVFPPDVVIGPSNPNPRPVPEGAATAPLEENCRPAFDSPETYYTRILTTKGFTPRQRLVAALAYADWFDFKHLPDSAKEMYRWALDIATSSLDQPETVIDASTGVIKPDAPTVSSNILLATTSLAMHEARHGNLSTALPIFVSVLRARRALPPPPAPAPLLDFVPPEKPNSLLERDVTYVYFRALLRPLWTRPPYPAPPPSGDEPVLRTPVSICEEAGLMANIGEILYATASTNEGLAWTREAVEVGETQFVRSTGDREAVDKCRECLDVATGNWLMMVERLAKIQDDHHPSNDDQKLSDAGQPASADPILNGEEDMKKKKKNKEGKKPRNWWFWSGAQPAGRTPRLGEREAGEEEEEMHRVDWIQEQALVGKKVDTLRRMIDPDRFEKPRGAWFGTTIFG